MMRCKLLKNSQNPYRMDGYIPSYRVRLPQMRIHENVEKWRT